MIPLVLRLQDFMSYATLDLDLRGIHSAVLSGANGSGKSSLLDAMTYALWDRARAGGEELIRLNQPEMWVELLFQMDGQAYRVWRRRTRKKGVQSQLTFQQLDPDGNYVSLDGNTLRETQGRINDVLRMGYETFVNSAFILQGQADHFTTKTPRERKAVLGDILGLQHYDDLSTRARERWKAAQARADALEGEQAEVRGILAQRGEAELQLARAREGAESFARLLALSQDRHTRLLGEEAALASARQELELAEAGQLAAQTAHGRLTQELATHDAEIERARAEISRRADIEADFVAHGELTAAEHAHRERADRAHAVDKRLALARQESKDAQHAHALALQGLEAEQDRLERERKQHQDVAGERERIEQAREQLVAARQAEALHMEGAQAHGLLEKRRLAAEQELQQLQLAHDAQRRDRERRLTRAKEGCAKLPELLAAQAANQAEVKALEIAAVEQDRVKEKGLAYKARREQAEQAIETARKTRQVLEGKLAQLAVTLEVHTGGRHAAPPTASHACPLCQTDLDDERLQAVIRQYRQDIQAQDDEVARFEHEAAEAEQLRTAAGERYKELAAELKQRAGVQERAGELRTQVSSLEAVRLEADTLVAELAADTGPALPERLVAERDAVAVALQALAYDPAAAAVLQARVQDLKWAEAKGWQLEQALAALAKLDARLPGLHAELASLRELAATAASAWQDQLATLEAELAAVGHDPVGLADVQARLKALHEAPARHARLQQQLLWLEGAANLRGQLESQLKLHAERSDELERAKAAHRRKLERQPLWQQDMANAQAELDRFRLDSARRHEEVGRLEAEIVRLDELERRLATKRAEWQGCVDEAQTYKELCEAFGKNGIQALIIENALPELEEEANRLLARITDNRMHVRLATQREKKSGGAAETLEIYISDEVGTRNYEMYSGGEAFRVNFALRLALSRLLAQRAGARLQTLVIDEGFGTQDEKGRERLVEAINAVSGEFERILVITHVRELKDAFNTHIEVTKRGGLSEVKLSA